MQGVGGAGGEEPPASRLGDILTMFFFIAISYLSFFMP
jgi:hypothetical protein